ncbi:MAG: hypothetical protein RMK29_01755 [Myxococcales bacterium]|nr:hypothetical protein [Myxococcota bacterium]MDW8280405.1 hypothetical protein [Myxococcales bacterium]
MRRNGLPLLPTKGVGLTQDSAEGQGLGVLSVHLDGGRCRVGCPFCYLGRRTGRATGGLDVDLLDQMLATLPYREIALALSEPVEPVLPVLERIARTAAARGRLLAVTTTPQVVAALPPGSLTGVGRLSLSLDPWKGPEKGLLDGAWAARAAATARAAYSGEIVLIVTLSTRQFAQQLLDGLLGELLALAEVDRVALNAVKPPPPWCNRRFWLFALSRIAPLLRQHLDRRLFLDCYVAARLLGLGSCPARPDLSPAPDGVAGVAFRGCVYQPAPDYVTASASDLCERLKTFCPPAVCPFPID